MKTFVSLPVKMDFRITSVLTILKTIDDLLK